MKRTHASSFLALAVLASGCFRARGPAPASLPPVREVALTVEASVADIPANARELRLWIPVPRDEGAQSLLRVIPEAPGGSIVSDSSGNPAILVVMRSPASNAAAKATFEVSRAAQRGAGTPHPLAHAEKTKDPEAWLSAEPVEQGVAAIATGIFATAKSPAEKARAAWRYLLDRESGDAALFVALLRAGAVPARVRTGFSLPEAEREGTIAAAHHWAEWWNPERGWTPVDPSGARSRPEKRDFYFGNLDADRVGMSLGRGSALPYAEVDGTPIAVATTVTFRSR